MEGKQLCLLDEERMKGMEQNQKVHPNHYNDTKITPFDVIDDWGLDFYVGTALKYMKRAGKKSGESVKDDLEKAIDYLKEKVDRL